MPTYAFFGGAFDPPHWGHIRTLTEISQIINYNHLFLLPYNISSTGKKLSASATHRMNMLEGAFNPELGIKIDYTEITKTSPAYTYDTLMKLRSKYGDRNHFSFIIGDDCYANLDTWKNWRSILELANLVVINRLDKELSERVKDEEKMRILIEINYADSLTGKERGKKKVNDFLAYPQGAILKLTAPLHPISSSGIRAKLKIGEDISSLAPPEVLAYISRNNLYYGDTDG